MKKRIFCGLLAAACALSMGGCFDMGDEDNIYPVDGGYSDDETNDGNTSYDDSNDTMKLSENSGTRISLKGDDFSIMRRTRETTVPMGESGWTIMVYLCGTDLETDYGAASSDLYEAMSADYSEDVRFIVQTGGTYYWQNGISSDSIERYVLTTEGLECVEELPAASMGRADTLASFVSWGVENYPAANMGFVFWNHGGGSISGVCFDELNDSDSLSQRA